MRDHPAMLIASDFFCCTFEDLHESRQNCALEIARTGTASGLLFEQLLLGSIDIVDGSIEIAERLLPPKLPDHRPPTEPELEWRRQVLLGREDELFQERRSFIQRSRLEHLRQWLPVFATDSCEKVGQRLLALNKAHHVNPGLLRRQRIVVPTPEWRVAPARILAALLKQPGTPDQPGTAIQPWHAATLALLKITRISEYVFDDLDQDALDRMDQIVTGALSTWPAARQLVDTTAAVMKASAYAH
ncbi:Golgi phosphoprotein 3 GPP34 [Lentzea atacamensis]|uniref:Golgi phosphoprotein 3 GPP34 n=1 Tax=Lentzea atacamensis TaxID=531938 RepID=A0ABX9DYF6_9PSEU|nr:hypothetical protein [Lentzea atacamensis]RAS59530.1 Golgi phosphoprotein 3 GPP34 [Lentzea atacamensis]